MAEVLPDVQATARRGDQPALFEALPSLRASVPWRPLGEFPTRVHRQLDLTPNDVELWIKREDESSPIYGGNKLRKLEFLLAEAERRGARRVVTIGRWGSHHLLAVGVWGRRCGFEVDGIIYPQTVTAHVLEVLRADAAIGVNLRPRGSFGRAFATLLAAGLRRETEVIRGGGSTPLGNLGFVSAGLELAAQIRAGACPNFDVIYVPAGTGGTAAGLWVGLRLAGLETRLVAVEALRRRRSSTRAHLLGLARELVDRFDLPVDLGDPGRDLHVDTRFYGPGYGIPSPETEAAVRDAAAVGLGVEITYSGKALAALLHDARTQALAGQRVLFISTCSSADLNPLLATGHGLDRMPPELARLFEKDQTHAV